MKKKHNFFIKNIKKGVFMKKILLIILSLATLFAMSGCNKKEKKYKILVASRIENKRKHTWYSHVRSGKVIVTVPHTNYYFTFIENEDYEFSVGSSTYSEYEIGDYYVLSITDTESNRQKVKTYFFESSITYTVDLEGEE